MGYLRHDAIVVTSWKEAHLRTARLHARELGLEVSEVVEGRMNGQTSFLIAPDGSKEGWKDSDDADAQRDAWKAWARSQSGDLWIDWAHVNFGGDDARFSSLADHNGATETSTDATSDPAP